MFKTEFLKKTFFFVFLSFLRFSDNFNYNCYQLSIHHLPSNERAGPLNFGANPTLHSYGNPQHDELKDKGNLFGNIYSREPPRHILIIYVLQLRLLHH